MSFADMDTFPVHQLKGNPGLFMPLAIRLSKLSGAKLAKVGVVLEHDNILVTGCNGLVSKDGLILNESYEDKIDGELVSKPDVIHAEQECVAKAAKKGVSLEGSRVYITTAPCIVCARILVMCGVTELYYLNDWWDKGALDLLKDNGIGVIKYERN